MNLHVPSRSLHSWHYKLQFDTKYAHICPFLTCFFITIYKKKIKKKIFRTRFWWRARWWETRILFGVALCTNFWTAIFNLLDMIIYASVWTDLYTNCPGRSFRTRHQLVGVFSVGPLLHRKFNVKDTEVDLLKCKRQ